MFKILMFLLFIIMVFVFIDSLKKYIKDSKKRTKEKIINLSYERPIIIRYRPDDYRLYVKGKEIFLEIGFPYVFDTDRSYKGFLVKISDGVNDKHHFYKESNVAFKIEDANKNEYLIKVNDLQRVSYLTEL